MGGDWESEEWQQQDGSNESLQRPKSRKPVSRQPWPRDDFGHDKVHEGRTRTNVFDLSLYDACCFVNGALLPGRPVPRDSLREGSDTGDGVLIFDEDLSYSSSVASCVSGVDNSSEGTAQLAGESGPTGGRTIERIYSIYRPGIQQASRPVSTFSMHSALDSPERTSSRLSMGSLQETRHARKEVSAEEWCLGYSTTWLFCMGNCYQTLRAQLETNP